MFRACRTKAMEALGLVLLLPAVGHAQVAPQPLQQEVVREVAAGGLVFVQDPAIVIETEEMLIARNEINVTYVMRNTTGAERSNGPKPTGRSTSWSIGRTAGG